MALADYYARSALAASQVLAGFDEERIRGVLAATRVGIAIGKDLLNSFEGKTALDLLVRLVARMYPTITIRGETGVDHVVNEVKGLAQRINPMIDFVDDPTVEVVIGKAQTAAGGWPRIFIGSDGWNAFVGNTESRPVGDTRNPFGAGVAACLGAANLFRLVFQPQDASLDQDATFSAFGDESREGNQTEIRGTLGEIVLVGAGAIGNAAAWALCRISMEGTLRLVDPQTVDLGNLQRYVLAERTDVDGAKVEVLARHFAGSVRAERHPLDFANFVASNGYKWPRMLLALDSARDRRAAQASMPQWVANAWTQPGDLGVSSHDFLSGACVSCLYLPQHALENEDAIVASALGISDMYMQVRALLFNGQGVARSLLESIARARSLPIERLLPFEGRPIRALYTDGFCGGAVLPLGSVGTPRQEVHVPLPHQSALCGVLLAATAVRHSVGRSSPGTAITRINVLAPLAPHATQPAAKDSRGICICQDPDYLEVYTSKYGVGTVQ